MCGRGGGGGGGGGGRVLSRVLRSTAAMCRILKKEDGKHSVFVFCFCFGCFSYPFQGRLCRLLLV